MSDLLAELSQRAQALPPVEREQLLDTLLASLAEPSDPDVEAGWDAEIRRRVDEVRFGTAKLLPADDVFSEARRSIGR